MTTRIHLYDDPTPQPGEVGNRVFAYKDGTITIVHGLAGMTYRGRVGERYKNFDTCHKAKLWVTRHSKGPEDWTKVTPHHSDSHPKLDFYDWGGRYVYSSTWYVNKKHAWAHTNKRTIGRIARSKKH